MNSCVVVEGDELFHTDRLSGPGLRYTYARKPDKEEMWYPEYNPSGYRKLDHEMLLKKIRAGML